jgi:hypothetical protein
LRRELARQIAESNRRLGADLRTLRSLPALSVRCLSTI